MKNTLKGVLLSGLVFPGLGQIAQRSYRRGALLILATMVSLGSIMSVAVKQAGAIFHQIETEGGVIDIEAITAAVDRIADTTDTMIINGAFAIIVALWLFGMVDAYRTGRKQDAAAQARPRVATRSGR